ncbi:hypothetical protein BDV12DRAFT_191930 [Aspergillus spectabilis]
MSLVRSDIEIRWGTKCRPWGLPTQPSPQDAKQKAPGSYVEEEYSPAEGDSDPPPAAYNPSKQSSHWFKLPRNTLL